MLGLLMIVNSLYKGIRWYNGNIASITASDTLYRRFTGLAKRSRFQYHRSFRGNIFLLPWPEVLITYERSLYLQKTFAVLLKTAKTVHESLAQGIVPRLRGN